MSYTQVWRTHRQYAATAARWTAEHWRTEADRRRALRAERKPLVNDARRALAQARAIDPQGTTSLRHRAERELATAKRHVPDPLWLAATKTTAGIAFAGYVGLPLVPRAFWLWSAVALTVAITGAVVWTVLRHRDTDDGLKPTAEEAALLKRLDPRHWREHAEQRGLDGTLTGRPTLTEAGIVCAVRLDGKWTAGKLRQAEDHIRALLGARTGLRMQIKAGKRGGWAELTLRTRSAADGDDLKWSPERRSLGVDTVTGDQVSVPLGERLLIAGRSGAGKSVASRPLLFDASEGPTNALVIIDLKRVEGRLWDHRARVASTPEQVITVVDELVEEMQDRLSVLPKGQDTWTPSRERPRITVVVDEGAEVMTSASKVPMAEVGVDDKGEPKTTIVKRSALPGLESIARMGRAACIDLWWMTQKPTIDDGIPKQIAPQVSTRICLAVSTPTEARVVLGEDAQAKGWNADELPVPGVALIRDGKRKPDPVSVRYMDKAQIIALPAGEIWSRGPSAPEPTTAPTLTLIKDSATAPAAPAADSASARVLKAVETADEPVRQKDLADRTGLSKGAVSKAVRGLTDTGRLVRQPDGSLTAANDEAAA